ncbi:hypothetical protein M8542_31175 [Amycolatopsis sp. OK19-0408]|uniref:Uncharacterized protein n=1 Tax=Amycolatopsis iheyensis TaxID=2945988 RepID=A0A9X2SPA0_9PSEU|nr:hypothetical protein [Amycolatopsis iheyensis]MCR6487300.1 hypothetical protein [Amycolatopsis iheyensis]
MTTDDERAALASGLSRLPLPELVDVLRRVLPAYAKPRGATPNTLCLAEVWWVSGRRDLGPSVDVVAWPDREYYDGGFGPASGNWESGTCPECGLDVVSTAKRAFCPACSTPCWLT